jgi:hypothetical protein
MKLNIVSLQNGFVVHIGYHSVIFFRYNSKENCRELQDNLKRHGETRRNDSWSRILEKLIIAQPVRKFPDIFTSRKFIIVFSRARYSSLF